MNRPTLVASLGLLLMGCVGNSLEIGQLSGSSNHAPSVPSGPGMSTPIGRNPTSLLLRDLNGDGHLDVAVTNAGDQTLGVLLGAGDGTFGAQTTFPTALGPTGLSSADLNRDGIPDLVCAETGAAPAPSVAIYLGLGGGTFGPRAERGDGNGADWSFAGDFDGDGNPDVGDFSRTGFNLHFGAGNGTLASGCCKLNSIGTGEGQYQHASGTVGDFNGDGLPDIVVGDGQIAELFLNPSYADREERGFVAYPNIGALPSRSDSMAVADLDGDGNLDLIIASASPPGAVVTFLGHGDATLAAPRSFATGAIPVGLIAVDLDGDGHVDAAVTSPNSEQVILLRGGGDGSLQLKGAITVPHLGAPVGAGDVNGDGRMDLVVVADDGNSGGRLVVLLNQSLP